MTKDLLRSSNCKEWKYEIDLPSTVQPEISKTFDQAQSSDNTSKVIVYMKISAERYAIKEDNEASEIF